MSRAVDLRATVVEVSDGTIGCHSIGAGPGVVIVHGAMQSGLSQADLARLLAERHEVHLMDRRGRGASTAPLSTDPAREVEDVRALVAATGSRRVLGVSSGALLAARFALTDHSLDRLVLFEPPLSIGDSMRLARVAAFDEAMDGEDLARAMAVAMRISEMGPPWMFRMPVPLLAAASRRMLSEEVRPLALGLAADLAIVRENADRVADFTGIDTPTLVLSGAATRPYLRGAAAALAATIPTARHVIVGGQGHAATQNRDQFGAPDAVAPALLDFLA
jgi:pimeloyl-ACP methyl ester carboxylesterase